MKRFYFFCLAVICLFTVICSAQQVRIIVEAEDMQGVNQKNTGPGKTWQVGRWGYDLYQNMTFGGVWTSRLRTAMTDAGDNPAEMKSTINVPENKKYKLWVKYECVPFFNYTF
ncbi:MAG TPA: hypothetical protein PLS78_00485, partial [bacterium]|nr:hypothetical protein [bacterium]